MDNINQIPYNEFDHLALSDVLKSYRYPKDRITKLIKSKRILPIKRGLYVKGDEYRKGVYSKEIVANLLYGPSYISLEYALSYYGMIPEQVEVVTSVTMKKRKEYGTPLGWFIYFALNRKYYSMGLNYEKAEDGRGFLIATPEKALLDKIYFEKNVQSKKDMFAFLFENLRIDEADLKNLEHKNISEMVSRYQKRSFFYLLKILEEL